MLVVVVGVLFVALLGYGVLRQAPDSTIDDTLAAGGSVAAPAFELELLEPGRQLGPLDAPLAGPLADGRLGLSELRGVPVVLNVWASWCGPCRDEAPLLERTWRDQARPTGVLMLGLNMQDARDDARAFLREFDVTYPNVRESTNATARRYGATGLPETFFITARGRIVGHVVGVIAEQQLTQVIAAARQGTVLGARSGVDRRTAR